MKGLLRSLAAYLLALLARAVLHKYKPLVVMVTGSVGKTSTKDAVAATLGSLGPVRASEKSYNSEFGVPLTIIGVKNPWKSFFGWVGVIERAFSLILFRYTFPKVLVLEVGADRPGDLSKILRIGVPDAVVVTRLPDVPVHVEAYASTQAVKDEEFTPAFSLAPGAPLILASNNEYALTMGKKTMAHMVTFGFAETATVHISNPEIVLKDKRAYGMRAVISWGNESHTYELVGALGRHQMLAPAAAVATAISLGVSCTEACKGLSRYVPPAGRTRLLRGLLGTTLVDDTYNSSPAAAEEALTSLALVPPTGRAVAVLGDMLELGRYSVREHERIGTFAAEEVDVLVTVGIRSRVTAKAAEIAGLIPENIYSYDSALDAAHALTEIITTGDVILIKGSQSMRMERVTEALLENPEDAKYLVRQEKEWKRR